MFCYSHDSLLLKSYNANNKVKAELYHIITSTYRSATYTYFI